MWGSLSHSSPRKLRVHVFATMKSVLFNKDNGGLKQKSEYFFGTEDGLSLTEPCLQSA